MSQTKDRMLLSKLPFEDPDQHGLVAVIETPKGSPDKYDYDEAIAAFRLASVLPLGMVFPYDFGFIPSTLGADGDPLDALVFLDSPVPVGCVLTVRLIGVIEAQQRQQGEDWIRNDRLLAVATHARTHTHIERIKDLSLNFVDEIVDFFCNYNKLNGKEFKPLDRGGPKQARMLVDEGRAMFEAKLRKDEG
jgi:inorganic pyrophosphatase